MEKTVLVCDRCEKAAVEHYEIRQTLRSQTIVDTLDVCRGHDQEFRQRLGVTTRPTSRANETRGRALVRPKATKPARDRKSHAGTGVLHDPEAQATVRRMWDDYDFSVHDIAAAAGTSTGSVSRIVTLLGLPQRKKGVYQAGKPKPRVAEPNRNRHRKTTPCPECGQKFRGKQGVSGHMTRAHGKAASHPRTQMPETVGCAECDKTYTGPTRMQALTLHTLRAHRGFDPKHPETYNGKTVVLDDGQVKVSVDDNA